MEARDFSRVRLHKAILDSCAELSDMGYKESLTIGTQILHSGGYKQLDIH